MDADVVVIGAGLAGLSVARGLEALGADYVVIEARARWGGRILSEPAPVGIDAPNGRARDARYDLGPAWFWPGQSRLARLVSELGLSVFEQHARGTLAFEDEQGAVRRDLDFSTMAGSLRIAGGLGRLADGLAAQLQPARVLLGRAVTAIAQDGEGVAVTARDQAGETVDTRARCAVLALPPRLAGRLAFTPALDARAAAALAATPTWMAGQAKLLAVYDRPFWRDIGLSGDAASRRGPLVEIHDASPQSAEEGALFGFIGAPPSARHPERLARAGLAQLAALFGEEAARPRVVLLQDWAREPFTAAPDDVAQPGGHPLGGLARALTELWDGRLVFASAELGRGHPGLLEGALEAAEDALAVLKGCAARAA